MGRSMLAGVMLAAGLGMLASSMADAARVGSVEIRNRSEWELHYLYIGPAGDPDWGPDQLRNDIIPTDTTFTLTGIRCGQYDVKVVDEDGDSCEIYDVRLCDDKVWDITNKELLTCQAETEQ